MSSRKYMYEANEVDESFQRTDDQVDHDDESEEDPHELFENNLNEIRDLIKENDLK